MMDDQYIKAIMPLNEEIGSENKDCRKVSSKDVEGINKINSASDSLNLKVRFIHLWTSIYS